MSTYEVKLLARREVADGTMEFHFSRPQGFQFKAGQAVELILPEPASGHAFSLVNAPGAEDLVIATRMRDSAYKRALRELPVGAPVKLDGPFGSLTLHKATSRAAVFIAGGIGITPFMSMLRERTAHRMVLVYSNRRARDSAYLTELQELARLNPQFRLVTTMTEEGGTFVDAALLRQASHGLPAPVFYVAGPPAMVDAMKRALDEAGVEDTDVRSEEFFGYETAALKDEAHRAEAA
jgi:ferredoxin-NADP reductase